VSLSAGRARADNLPTAPRLARQVLCLPIYLIWNCPRWTPFAISLPDRGKIERIATVSAFDGLTSVTE
jgi:hypothetical protein